jgi:hypothetical protein
MMAGSTNFIQTNPSAANQEDDATYAADSLTTGGVGVDDILPSPWLNKVWFQPSTFVCALAYVIANWGSGFTITDTSLATLKTNLLNFLTLIASGIAGFTSGNNSNGYWETNANGRIEQWGTATIVGHPSAVTFPVAFTNASSVSVVITEVVADGSYFQISLDSGSPISTTGFTVGGVSFSGSVTLCWRATGY